MSAGEESAVELKKAREKRTMVLKNLSIDERLALLGDMMDTIARIKILMFMEATGYSEREAINILRERLIKLQESNR